MNNFPRFEAWCEERSLSWITQSALLARLVFKYGAENVDKLDTSIYYDEARNIAFRAVFDALSGKERKS